MRVGLLVLLLAFEAGALDFPRSGFSIDALEPTETSSTNYIPLMMLLPGTDGFSANVNIQVQVYPSSLDDYQVLSRQQFKSSGFVTLLDKKRGPNQWVVEYTGENKGQKMHWYALAQKKGPHVYLITATATEKQWPKLQSLLKKNVESFRLHGTKAQK